MTAKKSTDKNITNEEISDVLDHIAEPLEAQGGNVHRVRAYRNEANSYERDDQEDQVTVVTRTSGAMKWKRVVCGREAECLRYFQTKSK